MSHQFYDERYTQICSEKTLQANQEGFFLDFVSAISQHVGDKWLQTVFAKAKTDQQRLRIIYHHEKIQNIIKSFLENVQEVYRKKSKEQSLTKRLFAEQCLQNGKYKEALVFFNQSIMKAPKQEGFLALALLGRAKTYFKIQDFQKSLDDLQLSLKESLPETSKAEAFSTMAICHKVLGEEAKATVTYNLAKKLIGDQPKLLEKLETSFKLKYEPKTATLTKKLPDVGTTHAQFPNASNKILIKNSQELGRFVIAKKLIQTGETLVVEPAYAACLLPEKFGTHCHFCFERLISPIPCPDCSSVAFCSLKCQKISISSFHKYECKFLDLLLGSGMSILSHTTLRIVTQTTLDAILESKKKEQIYNLCTNSEKRTPADFLQRTLMAAFLLRCLQKSGYFNNKNKEVLPTEEELQIGEILLFHLQMLQFNAHEVYETLFTEEKRLTGSKQSSIGVALYPTVALFNHDCYPAVIRHFVGRHIVITALRTVRPGESLSENYGPIFTARKLTERQRSLSARYWFNCQCSACLEDWPSLKTPGSLSKRVRCPTHSCTNLLPTSKRTTFCNKCKEDVTLEERIKVLEWCEKQYELGFRFVEEQNAKDAIDIFCEALDEFHRVAAPPHKETHLAEIALRVCLADSGNKQQCVKNQ